MPDYTFGRVKNFFEKTKIQSELVGNSYTMSFSRTKGVQDSGNLHLDIDNLVLSELDLGVAESKFIWGMKWGYQGNVVSV